MTTVLIVLAVLAGLAIVRGIVRAIANMSYTKGYLQALDDAQKLVTPTCDRLDKFVARAKAVGA